MQRTRIASGIPYFERFLHRFPTIRDLATAPVDDVLAVWEGLGFYGRARNLYAAARAILERFGGEIPHSYDDLESLPGIGPYTAGAVASIAFGVPVSAVDGNVTRVLARLFRIHDDVGKSFGRQRIKELADRIVSPDHPGAFNQAMMDLGATVCTPTSPSCERCPLEQMCLARAAGEEREVPVAGTPRAAPTARVAFALVEADGNVLLVRRPPGSLLEGLWALPGGEIPPRDDGKAALSRMIWQQADLRVNVGSEWSRVDRTFSHRKWSGAIYRCAPRRNPRDTKDVRWISRDEALRLPLVPFHRKAIEALPPGVSARRN